MDEGIRKLGFILGGYDDTGFSTEVLSGHDVIGLFCINIPACL